MKVMVTEEWRSERPRLPTHSQSDPLSSHTHLHQHRFRQLLPVHDLDGHLLARDAVDPEFNQSWGAELKMWGVLL